MLDGLGSEECACACGAWVTHDTRGCTKVLSDPILVYRERRGAGAWGMGMVSPLVPGPSEAQVRARALLVCGMCLVPACAHACLLRALAYADAY